MITIRLPYETPPIRSNDRLDWHAKARVVKAVREATALVARKAWLDHMREIGAPFPAHPIDYPVTVTVVWEVTNNRVRDAGSSAPTGKAAIDGLVDAGVILSDRASIVTEERYRIEVGQAKGVRLEIRSVILNAPASPSDAPRADRDAIYAESGTGRVPVALSASQGAPSRPLVTRKPPPAGTDALGGKSSA